MKKVLLFVLLVVAGSILVACGESNVSPVENEDVSANEAESESESNENTEESTNEESSENEDQVEQSEDLSVGDTINFDGLHITVNDAYITYAENDEFVEPMNDFFLVVDASIENTTDEEAAVSSLMQISLLDAEGYSQDIDVMLNTKGQLDGEIGAGRKLAGEVAFDVTDSEYYEFIFEDPFTTGQAIWKFNKDELEEK